MSSQYNRQAADPGADAVRRGDEPVGADEGGTARVGAADLQRRLPRVLACSRMTSNPRQNDIQPKSE